MAKKIVVEIAEGLGNQLFMYAFAYSLSKKINYDLMIDKTSGYSKKKNLMRKHQKYMLDNLNINQKYASNKLKQLFRRACPVVILGHLEVNVHIVLETWGKYLALRLAIALIL